MERKGVQGCESLHFLLSHTAPLVPQKDRSSFLHRGSHAHCQQALPTRNSASASLSIVAFPGSITNVRTHSHVHSHAHGCMHTSHSCSLTYYIQLHKYTFSFMLCLLAHELVGTLFFFLIEGISTVCSRGPTSVLTSLPGIV